MSFYQFNSCRCHFSRRNGPIKLLKLVCFKAKIPVLLAKKVQIACLGILVNEIGGSCLKKYLQGTYSWYFSPKGTENPIKIKNTDPGLLKRPDRLFPGVCLYCLCMSPAFSIALQGYIKLHCTWKHFREISGKRRCSIFHVFRFPLISRKRFHVQRRSIYP